MNKYIFIYFTLEFHIQSMLALPITINCVAIHTSQFHQQLLAPTIYSLKRYSIHIHVSANVGDLWFHSSNYENLLFSGIRCREVP